MITLLLLLHTFSVVNPSEKNLQNSLTRCVISFEEPYAYNHVILLIEHNVTLIRCFPQIFNKSFTIFRIRRLINTYLS